MSFDDTNSDDFGEAPLPEESNNNRTFMIAVGILGGIILVSIACLGGVYLFSKQSRTTAQNAQAVLAVTQTAAVAMETVNAALTATFQAAILPTTTATLPPTSTPPVAPASPTSTPNPADPAGQAAGTFAAATATVGAAYTQAAIAAQYTVAPTTTALAGTGFADEYGLPGLVVLTLAFVIVILFARRLRSAPDTNK
jgi:type II secretory pathway pseudopilin PulG